MSVSYSSLVILTQGESWLRPASPLMCHQPSEYRHPPIVRRLLFPIVFLIVSSLAACSSKTSAGETSTLSRAIQNKGSDTLVNVALAWAEAYRDVDPTVSIAVTGGGSGTGIAALINGTVDIANSSRQIKPDEIAAARQNGIEPVEFVVAVDALAVIVNPKNPVSQLTIGQMSDIFTGRITNWKDVGGRDAGIVLVSRESNSGTHVYFLEQVVRRGESDNKDIFAAKTLMMPSSVGITSEVGRNPNAIGYDGLGYVTDDEKVIAVARDSTSPFILPSVETGADGSYPLARNLYMYTAGEPSSVIVEYLDWIRGPEGQKIVARLGFVPITQE
jgi:phosphate transport system substrate-binding protein